MGEFSIAGLPGARELQVADFNHATFTVGHGYSGVSERLKVAGIRQPAELSLQVRAGSQRKVWERVNRNEIKIRIKS